ncbi:hypothetical protein V1291_003387 [Nitrobacteraceae bacterium AZCC 1564]
MDIVPQSAISGAQTVSKSLFPMGLAIGPGACMMNRNTVKREAATVFYRSRAICYAKSIIG